MYTYSWLINHLHTLQITMMFNIEFKCKTSITLNEIQKKYLKHLFLR